MKKKQVIANLKELTHRPKQKNTAVDAQKQSIGNDRAPLWPPRARHILRLRGLALRSVPDSGTITKYFGACFRLPRFGTAAANKETGNCPGGHVRLELRMSSHIIP